MELLEDWLDTFQSVITGPREYFGREQRRDGFGYPLKFALVSLFLAAAIQSVRILVSGPVAGPLPGSSPAIAALANLVVSPLLGLVVLAIGAAIVHVFAALFGAERGYSQTFAAVEYGTALSPLSALASLIPVVGWLVSLGLFLYLIHVDARALESFQDMSYGRAGLSLWLPLVLLFAVIIAAAVVMGALMASLIGNVPVQ